MCGSFTQLFTWSDLQALLRFEALMDLGPTLGRVRPTSVVPIVAVVDHRCVAMPSRWGLVPSWAEDVSIGSRLINARSETVAEKPSFKRALASRRCIVPASGFHEWAASVPEREVSLFGAHAPVPRGRNDAKKTPYLFTRADGRVMLLAGLWERWTKDPTLGPDGLVTFTIITTAANDFMAGFHDRMPAILEPDDAVRWLDEGASVPAACGLLRPAADGVLLHEAVAGRL